MLTAAIEPHLPASRPRAAYQRDNNTGRGSQVKIVFYVKRCRGTAILRRWCVFATAGPDTVPVLIQAHHLTYRSAQSEADRLNTD